MHRLGWYFVYGQGKWNARFTCICSATLLKNQVDGFGTSVIAKIVLCQPQMTVPSKYECEGLRGHFKESANHESTAQFSAERSKNNNSMRVLFAGKHRKEAPSEKKMYQKCWIFSRRRCSATKKSS